MSTSFGENMEFTKRYRDLAAMEVARLSVILPSELHNRFMIENKWWKLRNRRPHAQKWVDTYTVRNGAERESFLDGSIDYYAYGVVAERSRLGYSLFVVIDLAVWRAQPPIASDHWSNGDGTTFKVHRFAQTPEAIVYHSLQAIKRPLRLPIFD